MKPDMTNDEWEAECDDIAAFLHDRICHGGGTFVLLMNSPAGNPGHSTILSNVDEDAVVNYLRTSANSVEVAQSGRSHYGTPMRFN